MKKKPGREYVKEMPCKGSLVVQAAKDLIAQGPAAVQRIVKDEIDPFIDDVKTLCTSMANLYQEHAADFLVMGLVINVSVTSAHLGELFQVQVGANPFADDDINIIHNGGEDEANPA